jgi:hypothetical protein
MLSRNSILILSPAFSFIPSLIGLGIARPIEDPHLTRVPWNSADIEVFIIILYICYNLDGRIDLNIYDGIISMIMRQQTTIKEHGLRIQVSKWKTIGIKVRNEELPLLNRQLDRLNYITVGDLVKDLIAGKITRFTDDQQIDIMKTNLQTSGQVTGLSGKPYDF